jgi:putative SOS response-associated peptidase YedK
MMRDEVWPAAEIHGRMPIALPKDAEAAWLDPALTDTAAAIDLARARAVTGFVPEVSPHKVIVLQIFDR